MTLGDQLTRWTVRFAILLYLYYLGRRITGHRGLGENVIWTAGCCLMWLHTACAFHFVHGWSHSAAYAATAAETAAMAGLNWGGGLYVNYLFLIIWTLDAAWWWLQPPRAARPLWVDAGVHGFLAFVAINGAIVFADGLARWLGVAGLVTLTSIWLWQRHLRKVNSAAGAG